MSALPGDLRSALRRTYVELPSLNMLAGLFAGDDHNEFSDLAAVHPLFELRHDLLDVRLDLVVSRHYVRQ